MNVFRKPKDATSELTRPTTTSDKPIDRRRFLFLFGAGVIATGLFGAKALAEEKPTIVASVENVGASSEKKVQPAGDRKILGYTLTVNGTNFFIGDPVLVSVVNSRGEFVKGEKIEITEPSGNKFTISVDNLQNGFVARTAGDYVVKYGNTKLVVTVREMDAELKALDPVSIQEIEGYVKSKYATVFVCKLNRKSNGTVEIGIYDSETRTKLQVDGIDASDLIHYKKLFDGEGISSLALGFEAGNHPKRGEYGIFYIVPLDQNGELVRGMPFVAKQCITHDNTCGIWYGRLQ